MNKADSSLISANYQSSSRSDRRDYLFWTAIYFYLDPGGYLAENDIVRFSKTVILIFCIFLMINVSNGYSLRTIKVDRRFVSSLLILAAWMGLYFLLVFVLINDQYTHDSIITKITKTRLILTGWILIIPVYYFSAYRDTIIFLRVFSYFSILFGFLFLLKVFFNFDVINVSTFSRGFVGVDRNMMGGFGILEFGLYLLIALFLLPSSLKIKLRNPILISSILIYMIYILSLTRRYVFFIFMAVLIGIIYNKYLTKGHTRVISRILIGFGMLSLIIGMTSSEYLDAMILGVSTVGITPETSYGSTYDRMSLFSHKPTLEMFFANPIFGTGYINEWYSNDIIQYGLEGADYVFLSSLAMFGIVGLLLFLPFYFYLYGVLFRVIKLLRNNLAIILSNPDLFWSPILIFSTVLLYFGRHLLSYPFWFSFIGPESVYEKLYIFAGLLFGTGWFIMSKINNLRKERMR